MGSEHILLNFNHLAQLGQPPWTLTQACMQLYRWWMLFCNTLFHASCTCWHNTKWAYRMSQTSSHHVSCLFKEVGRPLWQPYQPEKLMNILQRMLNSTGIMYYHAGTAYHFCFSGMLAEQVENDFLGIHGTVQHFFHKH